MAFSEAVTGGFVGALYETPIFTNRRRPQSPYNFLNLSAIIRERAPPVTAAAAVRTRTLLARTRFIYSQCSTVEFAAVERAHRGVGLRTIVHGDERKAARFGSEPVHHQMDFIDGAVLFEQILKIVLGRLK